KGITGRSLLVMAFFKNKNCWIINISPYRYYSINGIETADLRTDQGGPQKKPAGPEYHRYCQGGPCKPEYCREISRKTAHLRAGGDAPLRHGKDLCTRKPRPGLRGPLHLLRAHPAAGQQHPDRFYQRRICAFPCHPGRRPCREKYRVFAAGYCI